MPTGPGHGGPLDGLRVLVSGGAGAIGTAVCAELLRQGARVVVADVRPPDKDWPGAPVPPRHETCDVADEATVGQLLSKLAAEGELPDVVCCHAGVNHEHPVTDFPMAEFDEIFRVNVRGAFVLAQSAARLWQERQVPGHLIFTTSWVAGIPWPGIAPYAASKAAVVSLMKSFAAELAATGIRANAIAPGIVSAGLARQQWDTSPEYRKLAQQAIALGTLQEPASVARALALMCTPDLAYMTGSVLTIDGGCSLSMLG
jgi:NAD(P)-dependent dehydrogenase (short-subunit alcohol dehydrogenase family)